MNGNEIAPTETANPFAAWLIGEYGGGKPSDFPYTDNPCADFALEVARDSDFPAEAEYSVIRNHLKGKGASPEAIDAFDGLWAVYVACDNGLADEMMDTLKELVACYRSRLLRDPKSAEERADGFRRLINALTVFEAGFGVDFGDELEWAERCETLSKMGVRI